MEQKKFQRNVDVPTGIVSTLISYNIKDFRGYKQSKYLYGSKNTIKEYGADWQFTVQPNFQGPKNAANLSRINLMFWCSKAEGYQAYAKVSVNGVLLQFTTLNCSSYKSIHFVLSQKDLQAHIALDRSITMDVLVSIRKGNPEPLVQAPVSKNFIYKALLDDPTYSDFTLVVKGEQFKVHKAILALASPVWKEIFSRNSQDTYDVDNFDAETAKHLLNFIYCEDINDMPIEAWMKTWDAANLLRIENLMEIAKNNLIEKLNPVNALTVFKWASRTELEAVKAQAWTVVKGYVKDDCDQNNLVESVMHKDSDLLFTPFSDILRIKFPLENEPMPTGDIQKILNLRFQEEEIMQKHKKFKPSID